MALLDDAASGAPRPLPPALFAAAALAALALATLATALAWPVAIVAAAALVALLSIAAGAFTALRQPAAALTLGPAAVAEALAITDADGALEAVSPAFAALMAARGQPAALGALAATPQDAAALFALRREALCEGRAHGILAGDLALTIVRERGRLLHTVERLASPAVADAGSLAATIVDIVPAPAAIIAPTGAIEAANDAFRSLLGSAARLDDAVTLEEGGLARLARQSASKGLARADVPLAAAPDRRVRLTMKPFLGEAMILAVSDVTDQSELEAHMAQSQKMQAIGQLAGGIAHDFNNVLTAIIGFSDLLLQNHRPSDPAFRDIMNIKQSAQRAAGLVKQLLAFSRRQTLRPTVLNLNDVVADLAMMLDRLLGEPIRLELAYGRDLWPVLADLSQIEQVVINLSVNARDAMPGGGRLIIRTRNVPAGAAEPGDDDAPDGDAVLIEIEDVGTGMPQHVLEKIFEPFFTTKAMGEGTGLGLSTVYGIVKQTGGTLAVSSEEGAGTTFRVYLPRAAVEARPAEAVREASPAAVDLTGNATLLLVEDEEAIRAFAARALSAKGYRVLAAGSGMEAAEIFAEEGDGIDLLLTDVIMPELDGPTLVKQIRGERPDIKVIFMSGYADGASVDDLGGAQFLPKPFTLKALAEAVKKELTTG
ncbi:MAG: hypothetical protein Gyms2KO_22060 [Gymnodinialimonas sp.]